MLLWPIAATAPKMIKARLAKITIWRHWSVAGPIASTATRTAIAIAATLGAEAKKAVTGGGAPSYTSGVHMWNGTAEILNASPANTNTSPKVSPIEWPAPKATAKDEKRVEPQKPKKIKL